MFVVCVSVVCVSVCVIRMDGQTACRILTKIWEWIAIYPRGNIGGSYLPKNPLRGRPHGDGLAKFNRRRDSARDHICLLVAPPSEFNVNIECVCKSSHSPASSSRRRVAVRYTIGGRVRGDRG